MAGNNIKKLRILFLLLILLIVAGGEYLTRVRTTDWSESLWVVIYPINADGSEAVQNYINTLSINQFKPIEAYFKREAKRYSVELKDPFSVHLAKPLESQPPLPPSNGNVLSVMFWSLKLRYWAWANDRFDGPKDIQIFVRYFDPNKTTRVAHSLGLQKGMLGIVNAFSSNKQNAQNNFVIAHEILHTLGASDKYDLATNTPLYPIGYAEPNRNPLYPQKKAEIMGGRIPISESKSNMPTSLKYSLIGKETAVEIRWKK